MGVSESFKPSVSFRSRSSGKSSAIESAGLRGLEKHLKRKVLAVDEDITHFKSQQNVLVSAFSKKLARNLHQSIETYEKNW